MEEEDSRCKTPLLKRKQTSETCGSKAKKTADGEEKEVQTESSGEETESSEEEEEMVDCVTDSQPLTDSPLASASQLDGMYSVHSIQVFLERTKNMKNVQKQTSETCGSKAKKTADGEEKEVADRV
ncbi:unnamed protein product [Boreogadus saida]